MEMSKADQIQIGMLGVIIVLIILQMSNVFGGGDDLAASAKNDLFGNTTGVTGANGQTVQPFNPAVGSPAIGDAAMPPSTPPAQPVVDPNLPKTAMSFDKQQYDFGTVTEGDLVKRKFKFKNTGKEPLIIQNAQGSCGCTVPKWPREPIAPGASGEIEVEFNSDKKTGKRDQQVTITANTEPANTIIRLTGEVTPKGGAAVPPAQ
jgi:hypothetical protein